MAAPFWLEFEVVWVLAFLQRERRVQILTENVTLAASGKLNKRISLINRCSEIPYMTDSEWVKKLVMKHLK